jgi:hypothetical protein
MGKARMSRRARRPVVGAGNADPPRRADFSSIPLTRRKGTQHRAFNAGAARGQLLCYDVDGKRALADERSDGAALFSPRARVV